MKQLFLALILSLIFASATDAATFYVAKTGSDSYSCAQAQSQTTPKLTINAGLGCMASGDRLEIKAGTYAAPASPPPSGVSWSAATTVARFGSDVVTVMGWPAFYAPSVQYIILNGLILDGSTSPSDHEGITVGNGAHHIRIINSEIKNSQRHGVLVAPGSDFNEFIRLKVHDNGVSNSDLGRDNGFYITSSNNLVEFCEIYNVHAIGIRFMDSAGGPTRNNIARYNLIHDFSSFSVAIGMGILLGDDDNVAHNNIIYNGKGPGISINYNSPTNNRIYNNTIYGNASYGIDISSSSVGAVVKNNIVFNNLVNISNLGASSIISNNVTTNPGFIDPAGGNFQLQSGSPAIDTGVDLSSEGITRDFAGGARPQGCCYDVGAYEYGATVISPPPPSGTLGITIDSTYPGYNTIPIDDGIIDAAGGPATTWASGYSTLNDHWVNIAFSSSQTINTTTLYWAYNTAQQKYMTSQTVYVQYWNGSAYQTVSTISHPGSDVASSSVTFPAINTTQLRFYQPANQGSPTYTGIFWITELDYGYFLAPPSPPLNLVVSP